MCVVNAPSCGSWQECKHLLEYCRFEYRLYFLTSISIANTIWSYLKSHLALLWYKNSTKPISSKSFQQTFISAIPCHILNLCASLFQIWKTNSKINESQRTTTVAIINHFGPLDLFSMSTTIYIRFHLVRNVQIRPHYASPIHQPVECHCGLREYNSCL